MSAPRTYAVVDDIPERTDRLLWVTLQGIVNRAGPALYLLADAETDGHWIEWYEHYDLA
ncbi:MAG: GxGYxYP domain-containing protein, partial [Planctomycetota bacterium]